MVARTEAKRRQKDPAQIIVGGVGLKRRQKSGKKDTALVRGVRKERPKSEGNISSQL